jgi:cell division protein FtsB
MWAFIGGIIALVLGIVGLFIWWGYFVKALMASLPIMFILGGLLATYLGIEEIKDRKASENLDENPDDLKQEVEQLKEEIKTLKDDKK